MTEEDRLKRRCNEWIKKEKAAGRLQQLWYYCATDKFYSGIPDYLLCARGRFGWVELKTPKGTVKPIQTWTHDQIRAAEGQGKVCRTVDEFKTFVTDFYEGKTKEAV